MLNKIVLSQDGLVVGNNQLVASGGGIYIGKTIAVDGGTITANLNSYSNTTMSGNITTVGNVTVGDRVILTGINRVIENARVINNSLAGNVDINILEGGIVIYNLASTANWIPNFVGVGAVTIDSLLNIDQSLTVVVAARQGGTAYYPTSVRVDGSTYPIFWQGGSTPSSGNSNSIDFYTYTIVKYLLTGAIPNPSFYVFAAQTRFA